MILVVGVNDIWIEQPFQAMGRIHRTLAVRLRGDNGGFLRHQTCIDRADGGYRRISILAPHRWAGRLGWLFSGPLARRLRLTAGAKLDAVVFTSPVYRDLVRRFGDVTTAYYAADDYRHDYGWPEDRVHRWESQIVSQVDHVFAISAALRNHFITCYGVDAARIVVSANAVDETLIPREPPRGPRQALPPIPAHFRPLAGVVGNVSNRIRLDWLVELLRALPWLHLAVIGEVRQGLSVTQREALDVLQRMSERVIFCGRQSYAALTAYAMACDVCLIPLTDSSINPMASPTRLFSCLPAACPILATPGCQQLEEFEPLVRIAHSPDDLAEELEGLRSREFDDGLNAARWEAAKKHTWTARARGILEPLRRSEHRARLPGPRSDGLSAG